MKSTVLVVDDEQNMLTVMRMVLEEAGHIVITAESGESGLSHLPNPNLEVVITDLKMPGMGGEEFVGRARRERPDVPVIVVTAHGTIRSAVDSIRSGAADYLAKPFQPEELEIAVHNALKLRAVVRENQRLQAAMAQGQARHRLIGDSDSMRRLLEQIRQVAPYKTSVLITGESGTGKELVARTLHGMSPRAAGPWVAINCSAIPRELMESELFGYVKGAFTGASQNRIGRLEQAQGGSLFLDEIGDLDLGLQAKLLRVLQEREYSPLGSDQLRQLDVRIIAATNRDLNERVRVGQFREDLLYRLDVYRLNVPPLRARQQDIPLLARAFLNDLLSEIDKPVRDFSARALQALTSYSWPGNVRELRNAVERGLLSCDAREIDLDHLPSAVAVGQSGSACLTDDGGLPDQDLDGWLAEQERRVILAALQNCDGVQAKAARRLGISERSLWHRIKKLGIQVNRVAG